MNPVSEAPSQFAWSNIECVLSYRQACVFQWLRAKLTSGSTRPQRWPHSFRSSSSPSSPVRRWLPRAPISPPRSASATRSVPDAGGVFSASCSRLRETCFDSLRSQPHSQLNFKFSRSFYFQEFINLGERVSHYCSTITPMFWLCHLVRSSDLMRLL